MASAMSRKVWISCRTSASAEMAVGSPFLVMSTYVADRMHKCSIHYQLTGPQSEGQWYHPVMALHGGDICRRVERSTNQAGAHGCTQMTATAKEAKQIRRTNSNCHMESTAKCNPGSLLICMFWLDCLSLCRGLLLRARACGSL